MQQRSLHSKTFLAGILAVLLLVACEQLVPLSEFSFDYEAQVRIEGDFFPANPGKSVLRIDRTFTIADSMDLERAHIRNAAAVLLRGSDTLSQLTWRDSAASYIFLNLPEFDPAIAFNPDSAVLYFDTLSYGGYKLDRVDFALEDGVTYTLAVTVDGVAYRTEFSPYPAVELQNLTVDSVEICQCGVGGVSDYEMIYTTIAQIPDSARLVWPEDESAWFYTIYYDKLDAEPRLLPQIFAFPGPVLSLQLPEPGKYELIIGAMNDTFYKHYYLRDFPANHPARNFFDNGALGYAGTLNEVYLTVNLVPAPGVTLR